MVIVPNNENFDHSFTWPNFESLYNNLMDSSFITLGRQITIHLPPIITQSSGLVTNAPEQLQYNPYLGRSLRGAPNTYSTTRTPGVEHTPRDVIYTAHIRHGPLEINDKNFIGKLEVDEVATTLIYEALEHVNQAESVTIDNDRYRLHKSPRPIGLQVKRYLIVVWKRINEQENG